MFYYFDKGTTPEESIHFLRRKLTGLVLMILLLVTVFAVALVALFSISTGTRAVGYLVLLGVAFYLIYRVMRRHRLVLQTYIEQNTLSDPQLVYLAGFSILGSRYLICDQNDMVLLDLKEATAQHIAYRDIQVIAYRFKQSTQYVAIQAKDQVIACSIMGNLAFGLNGEAPSQDGAMKLVDYLQERGVQTVPTK